MQKKHKCQMAAEATAVVKLAGAEVKIMFTDVKNSESRENSKVREVSIHLLLLVVAMNRDYFTH